MPGTVTSNLYRATLRTGLAIKRVRDSKKRLRPSGYTDWQAQCQYFSDCLSAGETNASRLGGEDAKASDVAVVRCSLRPFFENRDLNLDDGFTYLREMQEYLHIVERLTELHFFEPSTRHASAGIQYCVGDKIQHKYFGRGVVFGWDEECSADEDWCESNRIDELLKNGRAQPFYNLLMDDGTSRYCSQENLTLDESTEEVTHPDFVHLFPHGMVPFQIPEADSYSVRYRYPPSAELEKRYPEDQAIRLAQQENE